MIQLDLEKEQYDFNDLKKLIECYYLLKAKELKKEEDISDFKKIGDILLVYIDGKNYFPFNPLGRPLKKHEKLSIAAREYFSEEYKKINDKEKIYFLYKRYSSAEERDSFERDSNENKNEIIEKFFGDCFEHILRSKDSSLYWKVRKFYAPKNSPMILEQIKKINNELEKKIEKALKEQLGEEDYNDLKRKLGFCHRYWAEKKRILREEYGITWYAPTECNPGVRYD